MGGLSAWKRFRCRGLFISIVRDCPQLCEFLYCEWNRACADFNDPNDRIALDKLASLFPDRQIVPIACRDLVLGLGTIHCMTQQQPK